MSTFSLHYVSNPAVLRAIAPSRLLRFLAPYRDFLNARGFAWPVVESESHVSYDKLTEIFTTPGEDTPEGLVDSLFLVDEMSTREQMDVLLEVADQNGIPLTNDGQETPTDIAVQLWLANSLLIERAHAERFAFKPKSFEYFQSAEGAELNYEALSSETRLELQREMDDWFEQKRRGRGSRIFVWEGEHEVRFLIRHGVPFKREEKLEGENVVGVCYRPLKYDVVVYDRELAELQINADLVGEKRLYCRLLGKYLFGDENCFPGTAKYTLEPLREYGADALACGDVEGIDSIMLTEVQILWGGPYRAVEVQKATDLFAALDTRGKRLPENARYLKAVFKVKFADCKTPRTVKIRPSNQAEFTRDSDGRRLIEWMELRGFTVRQGVRGDATGSVLAGA